MYLALTFLVPGVDVRCTPGAFPPVPAAPGRRAGAEAGGPDPAEAGRLPAPCARAGPLPAECAAARFDGSTGTGKTWQREPGSPGISRPAPGSPGSRRDCPELTRAASGRVAGAGTGDGPQSGQTVRPDSRTGAPSAPLANTGTNTYSV